jgi:hypothetical protein
MLSFLDVDDVCFVWPHIDEPNWPAGATGDTVIFGGTICIYFMSGGVRGSKMSYVFTGDRIGWVLSSLLSEIT